MYAGIGYCFFTYLIVCTIVFNYDVTKGWYNQRYILNTWVRNYVNKLYACMHDFLAQY